VTDAGGAMKRDGLDAIVHKFDEMNCYLNVIGIDFDDVDDDSDDDDDDKDDKGDDEGKSHALISEV
jgi:hypothetical protein